MVLVSEDDLAERNEWIEDSYSREAEILTCLGLFQNCAFPEAKKHYTNLYNKLVKLRQIRSSIKESTCCQGCAAGSGYQKEGKRL